MILYLHSRDGHCRTNISLPCVCDMQQVKTFESSKEPWKRSGDDFAILSGSVLFLGTGFYFDWGGNLSALQPQADGPAEREVSHIRRQGPHSPSCTSLCAHTQTHTHPCTWTHIRHSHMHKIRRYKQSLCVVWHRQSDNLRPPEVT